MQNSFNESSQAFIVMPKLTNHQNKYGARYQCLRLCNTDLLLFPSDMFWATNKATEGDICLSDPNYSKLGSWVKVHNTIRLIIRGAGKFTVIDRRDPLVEINREIPTNQLQVLEANAIANLPFGGSQALRDCLSAIA